MKESLARDRIQWPVKHDWMWVYIFDAKWSMIATVRWWWELQKKWEEVWIDTQKSVWEFLQNAINKHLSQEQWVEKADGYKMTPTDEIDINKPCPWCWVKWIWCICSILNPTIS